MCVSLSPCTPHTTMPASIYSQFTSESTKIDEVINKTLFFVSHMCALVSCVCLVLRIVFDDANTNVLRAHRVGPNARSTPTAL